MATTEHVLRLKATLDTNEVKQQLDSLNSSRQPERASQHAGGQQQQLVMNGMLTGAVAGALLSNSRKQQAAALSRESKSFSKMLDTTMKDATGSITKTFAQAKAELKMLDAEIAQLRQRYRRGVDNALETHVGNVLVKDTMDLLNATRAQGIHVNAMRKMERLRRSYNNAIAGPGGIRAREKMIEAVRQAAINDLFASNPERMSGGLPYPGRPKRDFSRMPDPAAAKKAAASQSRWTSLGRWAAAYGLSLAGDQIAQLVGEDTTAGRIVGSMSRVGGMAAAGGATGMAAGPLGAAAGFAGGALLGAVKEIVSALNENTEAEKQMAALYAKEGYGKRVAGYRNIAASSSLMEGWRFERELESISVADLQEAEKAFTSIVNMLNTVDAAISGGKWTSAGQLESLLQQRQAAAQARGVALSRVEELRAEQQAQADKEFRKRERLHEVEEARRMSKFRMRVSEHSNWGDLDALRTLAIGFQKHMASAQDMETYQRAATGLSIVQSGIANSRQMQLASLRELLAASGADMSHVTSLGQYGYGMGEKNDNVERQMRVWEEQAQLQRDIRDILDSRSFPAAYQ